MYRIHQIKLNIGESKEKIPEKILKKIGGKDYFVTEWHIVKESIDARKKDDVKWVYSVDFSVASRKNPKKKLRLPSDSKLHLELAPDLAYQLPHTGKDGRRLIERPLIVGFGPAGLFCGLVLAQAGYRPVICLLYTSIAEISLYMQDWRAARNPYYYRKYTRILTRSVKKL